MAEHNAKLRARGLDLRAPRLGARVALRLPSTPLSLARPLAKSYALNLPRRTIAREEFWREVNGNEGSVITYSGGIWPPKNVDLCERRLLARLDCAHRTNKEQALVRANGQFGV